jgi:hypothetical protein
MSPLSPRPHALTVATPRLRIAVRNPLPTIVTLADLVNKFDYARDCICEANGCDNCAVQFQLDVRNDSEVSGCVAGRCV